MTGGRIKKIKDYVDNTTFMATYGDGLSNLNIKELVDFHNKHGKAATLTAVQPIGRFGAVDIRDDNEVSNFIEKPKGDNAWVNGGFYVFDSEIFNYIQDDETFLEKDPLENLAKTHQLLSFKHNDFWRPMDTLRDKQDLQKMWENNKAPWKVWKDK